MRLFAKLIVPTSLVALGAACSDQATAPPPSGPGLGISVAPLTLPGMTDACYGLTVYNVTDPTAFGDATQVWTQPSLCASQYGADGGIRFTGICDAQSAEADHRNAVRLVLNDIYTGGTFDGGGTALTADTDYINPCPAATESQPDNGCILTAPCTENQDSKLVFNLTVMRNAQLGFFDTVVKFQDIFCAAKLDCQDDSGAELTYLPIPGSSPAADGPTAVLAFACTGGGDAAETYMYLDAVVVTCKDAGGNVTRTATVDPSAGPGVVTPDDPGSVLFSAAVNRGDGLNGSQYWNVLLGLNLPGVGGETCTLTTTGTASETALAAGTTPEHTRYPVIAWDVPLTSDGARVCTSHPLNQSGDNVKTVYSAVAAPVQFAYQLHRVEGTPGEVTGLEPYFLRHDFVDPLSPAGTPFVFPYYPDHLTPTSGGLYSRSGGLVTPSNPHGDSHIYFFDGHTVEDACPNAVVSANYLDYDYMGANLSSYNGSEYMSQPLWHTKDVAGADLFRANVYDWSLGWPGGYFPGFLRREANGACTLVAPPAGWDMAWGHEQFATLSDGRVFAPLYSSDLSRWVPAVWNGLEWTFLEDITSPTLPSFNIRQTVTTATDTYFVAQVDDPAQSWNGYGIYRIQGNSMTRVELPAGSDQEFMRLIVAGDSLLAETSPGIVRISGGTSTTLYTPPAGYVGAGLGMYDRFNDRVLFTVNLIHWNGIGIDGINPQVWMSLELSTTPPTAAPADGLNERQLMEYRGSALSGSTYYTAGLDPSHHHTLMQVQGAVGTFVGPFTEVRFLFSAGGHAVVDGDGPQGALLYSDATGSWQPLLDDDGQAIARINLVANADGYNPTWSFNEGAITTVDFGNMTYFLGVQDGQTRLFRTDGSVAHRLAIAPSEGSPTGVGLLGFRATADKLIAVGTDASLLYFTSFDATGAQSAVLTTPRVAFNEVRAVAGGITISNTNSTFYAYDGTTLNSVSSGSQAVSPEAGLGDNWGIFPTYWDGGQPRWFAGQMGATPPRVGSLPFRECGGSSSMEPVPFEGAIFAVCMVGNSYQSHLYRITAPTASSSPTTTLVAQYGRRPFVLNGALYFTLNERLQRYNANGTYTDTGWPSSDSFQRVFGGWSFFVSYEQPGSIPHLYRTNGIQDVHLGVITYDLAYRVFNNGMNVLRWFAPQVSGSETYLLLPHNDNGSGLFPDHFPDGAGRQLTYNDGTSTVAVQLPDGAGYNVQSGDPHGFTPAGLLIGDRSDYVIRLQTPSGVQTLTSASCGNVNSVTGPTLDDMGPYYYDVQPSLVDGQDAYFVLDTGCGRKLLHTSPSGAEIVEAAHLVQNNSLVYRMAKWDGKLAYRSDDNLIGLYDPKSGTSVTLNDVDGDGNPSGQSDLPNGCSAVVEGPFVLANHRLAFVCAGSLLVDASTGQTMDGESWYTYGR